MASGLEFLGLGVFFGLVAGVSPGPLLALVFSETLKFGRREGVKVAISPLVTDVPIVLFVLFVLSNLIGYGFVVGVVSLFGAGYLVYLGVENLRVRVGEFEVKLGRKDALRRGVVANFLSSSPYLFWLSIGGPIIFKSLDVHFSAMVLFVLGFYSLLVGSKIGIALIVDKSKVFLESKYYLWVVRALGIVLILFSLIFVKDGLALIGLL
ncbi:MAG: LysE family transporter [Candidatus Bathyarchaeota archaeon]|nr:LysE family transporter [Candidatus Bathyarchaeota archaeon]